VDPGHEYFYDLARYSFNATERPDAVDLGPGSFTEGEAVFQWAASTRPSGGFFDYDSRALRRVWATMWAAT